MPKVMPAGATPERGKRYALNTRVNYKVRAELEEAANANGRSMLAEVEARIKQTLDRDKQFGGPQVTRLGDLMLNSFVVAAQFSASEDASPADWLRAPTVITALASVVDTVLGYAQLDERETKLLLAAIEGRVLTRIYNQREQERDR